MKSRVQPPELASGAGFTYESQVAALYLADLLIGGEARGLLYATAVRVQRQRKPLGAPLDDLVVIGRQADGQELELHLQVKRRLHISAAQSNTDFREVVHAAWDTLTQPTFQSGFSRVGVACEYITPDRGERALVRLHEGALDAHDGVEFLARFAVEGVYGSFEHQVHGVMAQLLQERIGRALTDDELWRFWRHFLILKFETSGEGGAHRHFAVQMLRAYLAEDAASRARELLQALEVIAREATTASFDLQALLGRLGGRFPRRHLLAGETESLESLLQRARVSASADLAGYFAELRDSTLVELGLELTVGDERQSLTHAGLARVLREGHNVVLEAEPGAGKSTTVLQIARHILADAVDRVPLVIVLPELTVGGRSVMEVIANRITLQGAGREPWSRLAQEGRLVLLLDGWNEQTQEERSSSRIELERFARECPGNALLIATRPQLQVPFRAMRRVNLAVLSESQQEAILATVQGRSGPALLDRLRRVRGMEEVLSIPLYLNALSQSGPDDEIRPTREGVLVHFVRTQARRPVHAEGLSRVFSGTHDEVLQSIASALTERGTTTAAETELRRLVAKASAGLLAEGQLGRALHSPEAIAALVAHHILVQRGGLYAFQHQQFQEWYASFDAERSIRAAGATAPRAPHERLDRMLDSPYWQEPVLFAIERMSQSRDEVPFVARTVRRTLGLDPMFAAQMLQRSTDEVWRVVAEPVQALVESWLAGSELQRAIHFMLHSGRPEFASRLWARLADPDVHKWPFLARGLGSLSLTALGEDWQRYFVQLGPEQKRRLLWEVGWHTDYAARQFLVDAVRADPSATTVVGAFEATDFGGYGEIRAQILELASPEAWAKLAARYSFSAMPDDKFVAQLGDYKRQIAETCTDSALKTRLLLELDERDVAVMPPMELAAFTIAGIWTDHTVKEHWLTRLEKLHPVAFTNAVVDALLRGKEVTYVAGNLVRTHPGIDQDVLRRFVRDAATADRPRSIAARLLDADSVRALLQEFIDLAGDADADSEGLRRRWGYIARTLDHVDLRLLVAAMLDAKVDHPRVTGALAYLLRHWDDEDDERTESPLDDAERQPLGERLVQWADLAVTHPDVRRRDLYPIAQALGMLANPEWLPSVQRLLDKDLAMWREQRASAQQKPGQVSEAAMSYVTLYRQVLEAFEGETARDVWMSYLDHAEFAQAAAFGLGRFGGRPPEAKNPTAMHPTFGRVAARREARLTERHQAPHPVAAAVLDRVDAALALGDKYSVERAVQLATAAARMAFGSRTEPFVRVLAAPGSMEARYGLLLNLVLAGESICAAQVLQGLEETYARIGQRIGDPDQWWDLERWYGLLAFTQNPGAMLTALARPQPGFRRANQLAAIASALKHAGTPQGLDALMNLPKIMPPLQFEHAWLSTVSSLSTEQVARRLMEIALHPHDVMLLGSSRSYQFGGMLATLLKRFPAVRKELIRRLHEPHVPETRSAIGRALGLTLDEEDVFALIELAEQPDMYPLREALFDGVKYLAVVHEPVEGNDNTHYLIPRATASLRSRLFALATPLAIELLQHIDRLRDDYGRPADEPRHPDLSSGVPWPREAPW